MEKNRLIILLHLIMYFLIINSELKAYLKYNINYLILINKKFQFTLET